MNFEETEEVSDAEIEKFFLSLQEAAETVQNPILISFKEEECIDIDLDALYEEHILSIAKTDKNKKEA